MPPSTSGGISTRRRVTESDPKEPEIISLETLPLRPKSLASPDLIIRANLSAPN